VRELVGDDGLSTVVATTAVQKYLAAVALACAAAMVVFAQAAPAAAPPRQLLVNPSFETGNFTGWGTKDMAEPFVPLAVRGAGFTPGFGLFATAPTDGSFVADSGFDGAGPDTIAVWQDVSIPAGNQATLTFDWHVGWDMFAGPTLNRKLDFVVEPGGGGTPLQTTNLVTTDIASNVVGDTGPQSSTFDLSAYQGQTIRVEVLATIPEFFTGPAHMQLDNFSLLAQATFSTVCSLTKQYSTKPGVAQSLCAKLDAAAAADARGDTKAADNILNAYENEVSAQSGKAFTAAQAATLTALAEQLK
jgi:hypothetical protein